METDRDLIVALSRGLQVLECFSARRTSQSLTEISEQVGLPKSTVARINYTLVRLGYMRQHQDRSYSLSPAVLVLAHPVLASLPIRQVAQPLMREMATETHGTVSLGVLDRDCVVYVETCRSAPNPEHLPDIGVMWPILESAIGRAMLAAMRPAERTRVFNAIRVADGVRWEAQEQKVARALRDYARYGYCISLEEIRPGFVGVGVPLREIIDGHRLAFNCAIPASDPTGEHLKAHVAPKLVRLVERVEQLLSNTNPRVRRSSSRSTSR